jgi:hypothetical protein
MSATDREASLRRTAAPTGGEEQEDLPPAKYQDVEGGPVSAAEGLAEQRREMGTAASTVGPTGAMMTDAQGRGALWGGVIGGVIGAAIMLVISLIPMLGLDLGPRMLVFGIVGLIAGSAAGAVFGGGRAPELEGEATDSGLEVPGGQRRP